MVFLRRICSSRPGDGEQRGQSLAALTARGRGLDCFQPQPAAACLTCRPDIVCPNRLGGMMQPVKAAHGAFLARRKLAASGSSRAPCAFPNLRCYPRCWLFSCLGLWSHPHIFSKEHQKERCIIIRPQRPSSLHFHGALRNILLSTGFHAACFIIASEQMFVNNLSQKIFLAAAASESNRFYQ